MDYVNLGKTGLKVSRLCLGCMTYGVALPGPLRPGSHPWALNEAEASLSSSRLSISASTSSTPPTSTPPVPAKSSSVASSKPTPNARTPSSPPNSTESCGTAPTAKASLARKSSSNLIRASTTPTDYVDLYQIHRWDYETPIEETMEALHDVIKAGKVRYIGASSMYAWQFAKALYVADLHRWTRFVSMQNHYNLLYREEEREMMGLCKSEGIGVIPWSPLARGRLTRPWQSETTKRSETDQFSKAIYTKTEDADKKVVGRLGELAEKRATPMATLALAWMLSKPVITSPIVGATKPNHLTDAVAALSVKLSPEEIAALEDPYVPHPVLGFS